MAFLGALLSAIIQVAMITGPSISAEAQQSVMRAANSAMEHIFSQLTKGKDTDEKIANISSRGLASLALKTLKDKLSDTVEKYNLQSTLKFPDIDKATRIVDKLVKGQTSNIYAETFGKDRFKDEELNKMLESSVLNMPYGSGHATLQGVPPERLQKAYLKAVALGTRYISRESEFEKFYADPGNKTALLRFMKKA